VTLELSLSPPRKWGGLFFSLQPPFWDDSKKYLGIFLISRGSVLDISLEGRKIKWEIDSINRQFSSTRAIHTSRCHYWNLSYPSCLVQLSPFSILDFFFNEWCEQLGVVATPIILALGRLRWEDHEFEVSLDYIVTSCLKKPPPRQKQGMDLRT
jgi:hypothetical protein